MKKAGKRIAPLVALAGMAAFVSFDAGAGITVFNQDSTNFVLTHGDEKMNAEGVKEYLDSVIGGGKITHFFISPNAQVALFDTKTLSPSWWRMDDTTVTWDDVPRRDYMLFTNGVDVIQVYIDGCRARGVSPWISMRMNDDHFAKNPKWWGHSRFWVDHPELRLKGRSCFDYRHKAVRDYHLAFVEEVLDRYDVDGFECDWMRFPSRQSKEALTEFMREVRNAAKAAAKRRGHAVLVSVRVDSRPERMAGWGTDVLTWAKEGLTDWIVPCNFFRSADMELPIAEWQRLVVAANPSVEVIPGTDSGVMTKASDGKRRMMTAAEYRGWADRMFKGGAKGVYLFNLFTFNETKSYRIVSREPWDFILKEGLTPESIKHKTTSIPADWVRE